MQRDYTIYIAIGLIIGSLTSLLCSCTISFSNISTHGTAKNLVDETQSTTPTTELTIPLSHAP